MNRELTFDVVEQCHVFLEQSQTLVGDGGVAVGKRLANTDRIGQFQAEAAAVIQRLPDVLLERLEPAGRPRGWLTLLGAHRQARADREYLR